MVTLVMNLTSKTRIILQKVLSSDLPFSSMALMRLLGKKDDDPEAALRDFKSIVAAEPEKGDWFVLWVFS